jgi:hypothetical protein
MQDYCELKSYAAPPYRTTLKYFDMLETAETSITEYETLEDMKRGLHTEVTALSKQGWELVNVVDGVYQFRRGDLNKKDSNENGSG